jgi:lipid A oxidase
LSIIAAFTASAAAAETSLSGYLGGDSAGKSNVTYDFNDGLGERTARLGFENESPSSPRYYGLRLTHWPESFKGFGAAIDFTHAKAVADPHPDFAHFEFTNGLNFFTANILYRVKTSTRFTPYAGVGAGLSIPYVEVVDAARTTQTFEKQIAGVALQGLIGLDVEIIGPVSGFVEYKATYSNNHAHLEGGGSLSADLVVNQLLLGLTVRLF